ncbi:hypothetical protein BS78_05G078500, partial [Paspalum vaginatum]
MSQLNCNILSWKVRGLNEVARRDSVQELIRDTGSTIVCLQETKIESWSPSLLQEALGPDLATQSLFLPANGISGGVILAASERLFTLQFLHTTAHTISANVTLLADGVSWTITGVYGPQSDSDKIAFLTELSALKPIVSQAWMALGDYNLICSAQDKCNDRINIHMIQRFTRVLDDLQLHELTLHGQRFTWSNGQDSPTMTKIDHVFVSIEWVDLFPNYDLQAVASLGSDHSSL